MEHQLARRFSASKSSEERSPSKENSNTIESAVVPRITKSPLEPLRLENSPEMDSPLSQQKEDSKHKLFAGVLITSPPLSKDTTLVPKSESLHSGGKLTTAPQASRTLPDVSSKSLHAPLPAHNSVGDKPHLPSRALDPKVPEQSAPTMTSNTAINHSPFSLAAALSLTFANNKHHEPPAGTISRAVAPVIPQKRKAQVLKPHRLLRRKADVIAKQKEIDAQLSNVPANAIISPEEFDSALETEVAPVSLSSNRAALWSKVDSRHPDLLQLVTGPDLQKHPRNDDSQTEHDFSTESNRLVPRQGVLINAQERPRIVPHQSRTVMFAERLESMFGFGSLDRGSSRRKPGKARNYTLRSRYGSPATGAAFALQEDGAAASEPESGAVTESTADYFDQDEEAFSLVLENPLGNDETEARLAVPLLTSEPAILAEEPRAASAASSTYVPLVGEVDKPSSNELDLAIIDDWVKALLKLAKGKIRLEREDMQFISNILEEVKHALASLDPEILQSSGLRQAITDISQLPKNDIPFDDEHGLRARATELLGLAQSQQTA